MAPFPAAITSWSSRRRPYRRSPGYRAISSPVSGSVTSSPCWNSVSPEGDDVPPVGGVTDSSGPLERERISARAPTTTATAMEAIAIGRGRARDFDRGPVDVAVRIAATISSAVRNRSSGRLAIAVATTSSSPRGTPGAWSDGRGGGSSRCAYITATSFSRENGGRPVRHSKRTHPSEYRSVRPSIGSPRICSGAQYVTEPMNCPVRVGPPRTSVRRINPKSVRYACPCSSRRTLPGLTSRWTRPLRCADERAPPIWVQISTARSGGSPPRATSEARSDPRT